MLLAGVQAGGELHLELTYKPFEDDDTDTGYREAEAYALLLQQQAITDVKVSSAPTYTSFCVLHCAKQSSSYSFRSPDLYLSEIVEVNHTLT